MVEYELAGAGGSNRLEVWFNNNVYNTSKIKKKLDILHIYNDLD